MPSSIPVFNFKRLAARRSRVYTTYISHADYTGQVLDPPLFKELVKTMRKTLRLPEKCEDALRESLFEFAGFELTEALYDRIAVKLASGYDDIKTGKPIISSNSLPLEGAWLPIEVAEMRFDSVKNEKSYVKMTALIVAGSMAGKLFTQLMPAKSTAMFFATHLGWPKWGVRPAHSELVLMIFMGFVVSDRRSGLQIDEYKCTANQLKVNKRLREERSQPCLQDYRYQCKTCPIGYSRCPRGTHRYTWVPRLCQRCKDAHAIFDPAEPNAAVCLICRAKQARSMWAQERRGVT